MDSRSIFENTVQLGYRQHVHPLSKRIARDRCADPALRLGVCQRRPESAAGFGGGRKLDFDGHRFPARTVYQQIDFGAGGSAVEIGTPA